jgi:hypothetical protein
LWPGCPLIGELNFTEPQGRFLSALEGVSTVRKYFTPFDAKYNLMLVFSSTKNEVYRVQQKKKLLL